MRSIVKMVSMDGNHLSSSLLAQRINLEHISTGVSRILVRLVLSRFLLDTSCFYHDIWDGRGGAQGHRVTKDRLYLRGAHGDHESRIESPPGDSYVMPFLNVAIGCEFPRACMTGVLRSCEHIYEKCTLCACPTRLSPASVLFQ